MKGKCITVIYTVNYLVLCNVLQDMLERARQRREALKSRLKEASALTGQKRNVKTASNSENVCVDCECDNADEGIYTTEDSIYCKRKCCFY